MLQQQESVVPTLRSSELAVRSELHTSKINNTELVGRKHSNEQVYSKIGIEYIEL